MPRFVFWMGLVFAIIGLGVMAGGVLSHRSHQHIIDNGIRTRGVVVDLIRKTDGDGVSTYAPAVEYRDRNRDRGSSAPAQAAAHPPIRAAKRSRSSTCRIGPNAR